jgi:pyruvate dehydrogenase complex dehydrogenase (E1) component
LSSSQSNLRNIQTQLLTHRITLGNLKEYKTERFGRSKTSATEPKKEEWAYNAIAVGGVAGLIMSLFIAFFLEYLVEAGSRRKGK